MAENVSPSLFEGNKDVRDVDGDDEDNDRGDSDHGVDDDYVYDYDLLVL